MSSNENSQNSRKNSNAQSTSRPLPIENNTQSITIPDNDYEESVETLSM